MHGIELVVLPLKPTQLLIRFLLYSDLRRLRQRDVLHGTIRTRVVEDDY
jgi:hypothetical protein